MIIAIAGMHRSGTSLMASYLQNCGIMMGDDLVGATKGNTRGHFEDSEFVELHDDILKFNKSHLLTPKNHLQISASVSEIASQLIEKKSQKYSNWGWKDPRTSLFLNFWKTLDPKIKFLFLYRSPYAVIDSLFRRGTNRRIRLIPWLPAHSWLTYNKRIVNFFQENKKSSIIINIDGFNKNYTNGSEILSDFLGFQLGKPYTSVYHPKEFKGNALANKNFLSKLIFGRQFNETYKALESYAAIPAQLISCSKND